MLEYPRWKYLLVLVVLVLALILALPNLFGEDPALQVARKDHDPMPATALPTIEQFLNDEHLALHDAAYLDGGRVMVRFANTADQFKARDAVNAKFADQYITALSFASRAPGVPACRGPAADEAGPGSAGRPVPAVPGGHPERDFAAAGQLRAGSAPRAVAGESAVHGCDHRGLQRHHRRTACA